MWEEVHKVYEAPTGSSSVTYPQGWVTAKQVLPVRSAMVEVEFVDTFRYHILDIESVYNISASAWFVVVRTPQQLFARSAPIGYQPEKRLIVGPMELAHLPKEYPGKPNGYYPTILQDVPLYKHQNGRLYCILKSVVEATGTATRAIVREQTMYLEPKLPATN